MVMLLKISLILLLLSKESYSFENSDNFASKNVKRIENIIEFLFLVSQTKRFGKKKKT